MNEYIYKEEMSAEMFQLRINPTKVLPWIAEYLGGGVVLHAHIDWSNDAPRVIEAATTSGGGYIITPIPAENVQLVARRNDEPSTP
jgi:hypothetical protein